MQISLQEPLDGRATATISIDYKKAPQPSNYYVPDYFLIERKGLDVVLIFGKREDENTLRNKIEIYYAAPYFLGQLWESSREFHKTLSKLIENLGVDAERAGGPLKTDKVQTMRANNVLMTLAHGECVMDFYYLVTRDIYIQGGDGDDVGFQALVRILCSPTLLAGFLDACTPLVNQIRPLLEKAKIEYDNLESQQV